MKPKELIILLLFVISAASYSQNKARISTPDLTYYNDTLLIVFDIDNCQPESLFIIDLKIFSSDGNQVSASGFSGDLGDNITCGKNKKIIWSLTKDNLRINDDIEVQIFADEITINLLPEEKQEEEPKGKPLKRITTTYSRENVIASSLVFPGLGQKKVTGKSGYLALGILGYGSLAASGYFIMDYTKKYDQYIKSTIGSESDRLFLESEESYKLSKYFIYGAAGIWTVNLIWAAVIPTSYRNNIAVGIYPVNSGGVKLYAKWTF